MKINENAKNYYNPTLVAQSKQHGDRANKEKIIEGLEVLDYDTYTIEYDGYYYIYACNEQFSIDDIIEIYEDHYSDNHTFLNCHDRIVHVKDSICTDQLILDLESVIPNIAELVESDEFDFIDFIEELSPSQLDLISYGSGIEMIYVN